MLLSTFSDQKLLNMGISQLTTHSITQGFPRYSTMGGVAGGPFFAIGGDVTEVDGYKIHTFTSSSDFVIQSGKAILDILVVSGGGGGSNYGGGGAGGLVEQLFVSATIPGTYPIAVGAGGAAGAAGQDSVAVGLSTTGGEGGNLVDRKGGNAGEPPTPVNTGGTGLSFSRGGWNGGYYVAGGGGGGAGASGTNASSAYAGEDSFRTYGGTGGAGVQSFYRLGNTGVYYAGGGAGGAGGRNPNQGSAGAGGTSASSDGAANSGAGGGGNSRSGGSGIVVIRYLI